MTRHKNRRHQKGGFWGLEDLGLGNLWDKAKSSTSSLTSWNPLSSTSNYVAPATTSTSNYVATTTDAPTATAPTSSINSFSGGRKRRHKKKSMNLKGGKQKLRRTRRKRH